MMTMRLSQHEQVFKNDQIHHVHIKAAKNNNNLFFELDNAFFIS